VHPLGSVRSLAIEGNNVVLTDTLLVEGMLATRDFGPLEFIMLGPSDVEVHATAAQIDQITKWIAAESKE